MFTHLRNGSKTVEGRPYTGEVRSYLNGEHKVFYPYDQLTESQNFFFPDKPNFVGRGSWKLV